MGFLALVALGMTLGPLAFPALAVYEPSLAIAEWGLLAVFFVDVAVRAFRAPSKVAWLKDKWNVLDVLTVVGPLLALLPQLQIVKGALALRVARILRAAAFATRAGTKAARQQRSGSRARRVGTPAVTTYGHSGDVGFENPEWMPSRGWDVEPTAPLWVHSAGRDEVHLGRWAEAAGLPTADLNVVALAEAPASLRTHGPSPILVLQIPKMAPGDVAEVQRDWLLAVFGRTRVITVSSGDDKFVLPTQVPSENPAERRGASVQASAPSQTEVLAQLLLHVIDRHRNVADRFEQEVMRLDTLETNAKFLRDTFELRRTISAAELDLWHVKEIVRALADGKVRFGDLNLQDKEVLDDLSLRVESAERILAATKEDLQDLLQLNIDIKSFEMNKFLKLLAVIGFLGLIPSVIAGLLGMNVDIDPFNDSTIWQVAFVVGMAMSTGLYVFAIKGWLR